VKWLKSEGFFADDLHNIHKILTGLGRSPKMRRHGVGAETSTKHLKFG
jgi:hypothetical protein